VPAGFSCWCGSDQKTKLLEYYTLKGNWSEGPYCVENKIGYMHIMGRAVAQWLRRYATNRQVAGSIPDVVIEIFQ